VRCETNRPSGPMGSSTSADGSKYGSTSARCCNYSLSVLLMMDEGNIRNMQSFLQKYIRTVYSRISLDNYWYWFTMHRPKNIKYFLLFINSWWLNYELILFLHLSQIDSLVFKLLCSIMSSLSSSTWVTVHTRRSVVIKVVYCGRRIKTNSNVTLVIS